ncbi:hypothetical protein WME91_12550 [Sorangium sp. So ce269]
MKPETHELASLFELSDVGWVFEYATFDEDPDDVNGRIRAEMVEVESILAKNFPARRRGGLVDEIREDVTKFKPLVQAFASPVTAAMRAMVYAVLDGADVTSIQFSYEMKKFVDLRITVEYETGEQATFSSDDGWDVEVLRHFGIMKLGGKPVIDGYYAFRKAVA